jgi:N-hydroxyarylamine O-acetyltransferase
VTNEEKYLDLLGLRAKPPSLAFLSEIVKRHLTEVPYENVSKLIRFAEAGPTLPSFEEFVTGLAETNYGGTCFAQNIYLNQLLQHLGFHSKLVAIRRDGGLSHVSLRLNVEGQNHFVDVGIMSSVAGPFQLNPGNAFDIQIGNQRYVFTPKADLENYLLEIHRDGKIIRSFESSPTPVTETELTEGVAKTFAPSALFMTNLAVHRAYEGYSVGIWNKTLYQVIGTERVVREIQSLAELKTAFRNDLALPEYPLERVVELLRPHGVVAWE